MKRAQPHQHYEIVIREKPDGTPALGIPTFRHDVATELEKLGHRVVLRVHTTCSHGAGDFSPETKAEVERIDAELTLAQYIDQATRMKNAPKRSSLVLKAKPE